MVVRGHNEQFVDFMVEAGVLRFGAFETKSGRQTPYFLNTGAYTTAAHMRRVGSAYAGLIVERFGANGFDVLFGPAYKGIPLVVAVALALLEEHGIDARFCFNRKEAKAHGEKGQLVGHTPRAGERVLIVEDVTTTGTSIRETVPMLRQGGEILLAGLVVSVDRMERGSREDRTALEELEIEFGMPTASIVDLDAILARLKPGGGAPHELTEAECAKVETYRSTYGVIRKGGPGTQSPTR